MAFHKNPHTLLWQLKQTFLSLPVGQGGAAGLTEVVFPLMGESCVSLRAILVSCQAQELLGLGGTP